ncbi:PAS domain S-box protein [Nocardioides ganghwensis]|jgi:PAS domain S-box-containing protein|uniref:PAS domain S-box protein n=1 Tax=Nocardioides ganghwensis TaxID=252230 RepID=A0A4Q2SM45_9ACTN|nr:PAS domain S-box protein [Nocardioides ganghwensis]MBD3944879.1 PAS domain S-box protein [Nocardioides ganghwensis]RYC05109.1 PAS domain S-box protein [Nocardioides ganghwensis]
MDHVGIGAEEQLAAIGQAVITTDPEGVIVYWNAGAERLYGWAAHEVVGRNINEITVAEVGQDVADEIMAALRDGVPWSGGFPVRRKDGSTFPALVTDAGIHRDGALVGIVGVSTNLGSAIRPLLERSTDAALVLRHDAVITYASPAVEMLFGWDQEALIGTSVVGLLHDEDRRPLADLLDDVVRHPGVHLPVEVRVQAWNDWRWAEAAFTNLLDDPTVRGVVCNLRPSPTRVAKEQAELRARQLETALESRLGIELAKGYLVGHDGLTPDEAFQALRGYARSHHLTIHDVSRRVVAGEAIIVPPVAGAP